MNNEEEVCFLTDDNKEVCLGKWIHSDGQFTLLSYDEPIDEVFYISYFTEKDFTIISSGENCRDLHFMNGDYRKEFEKCNSLQECIDVWGTADTTGKVFAPAEWVNGITKNMDQLY